MASASYPFLDIVVLDEVRERFASGEALAVLSCGLDEILWANGAGAAWFGYPDVEAAIGAKPRLPAAALRQIAAAPGFPDIGRDRPMAMRITSGVKSRIVSLTASAITLPSGERALLLALPAPENEAAEQAHHIVSGFDGPGHFAALVEADGTVAAASDGFETLGIAAGTLEGLVRDVREEDDRLVKKLIETAGGRKLPAGIARLTDAPARHLLVVVDDSGATASVETEPGRPTQQAVTAPAAQPMQAVTPPAAAMPPARTGAPEGATKEATQSDAALQEKAPPFPPTVRFSWRTDAEGRFSALSEEFAEAMGKPAADIIGRSFREVSNAFGLDPDGDIARLLERRDTWSGRTVLWPLSGTNLKVPVDLAALPVYGRDRTFEGFRGFGIARLGEAEVDPEAVGKVLVTPEPEPAEALGHQEEAEQQEQEEAAPQSDSGEQVPTPESDPFQGEKPAILLSETEEHQRSVKIIRLDEHRENGRSGLSSSERSAFREIGERLRQANEALARAEKEGKRPAHDVPAAGNTNEPVTTQPQEATSAAAPAGGEPEQTAHGAEKKGAEAREPLALESGKQEAPSAPAGDPTETGSASPSIPPQAKGAAEEQLAEDLASEASVADTAEPEAASPEGGEPRKEILAPRMAQSDEAEKLAFSRHPNIVPSAFFLPKQDTGVETARALLASLPLPVLVHSGDRLHYANREFLRLVGYKDLAALEAAGGIGALFEEPSQPGEAPHGNVSLRTAEGERLPVEAYLQSIAWEGGKALMLALRPASAPAERISELEARLTEMNAILDTATDGIVVIAQDGTIRSINRPAEALFGFDAEHVTGRPFTSLFAIESQRTVEEYLAALSDNGVASVLNDGRQVIGREAQGRFIPLFITIGRLPGGKGHCAVLRDITHWKRAEEELTQARAQAERASSQKSEFLARVSHEIRTPLNAIIGFSELMVDEKFGPIGNDRYRDYLRDINRSGNHVLELVNDLLDISKIEAGQQEMSYEAVSLNDTLSQVVAMMQPQANSERVIIRSSLASRLPEVVADSRSVRQIAINLLSNAVRYTPAGGQVIVSTAYEKDGSVALRVRDTGVGMSSAEIDEALKPFRQINTLRRKRGDGTGLGLPLTRAMVEANRAQFSISSTPGEGTLVEVIFPPTRVLAD